VNKTDDLVRGMACALAIALAAPLTFAQIAVPAPSSVRSWGSYYYDTAGWFGRTQGVAAEGDNTAILRSDGRVFVQGANAYGECRVPSPPLGLHYLGVSLGSSGAAALRSDGEVVVWGSINPPNGVIAPSVPLGLRYTQVSVGRKHVLLLRSDGIVVAIGDNQYGQLSVPAWPPWVWPQSVQACFDMSSALLSDGSLVVWGQNSSGVTVVPPLPPGMIYQSYDIGTEHALAVRSDGQIIAWGDNQFGECNVPPLPSGVTYVKASAGTYHSVALRSDGSVVAWGDNFYHQLDVPTLGAGEIAIDVVAGHVHSLSRTNQRVLQWGDAGSWQLVDGLPLGHGGVPTLRHVDAVCPDGSSLLVLSDGSIQAFGDNAYGQCNVPSLPRGVRYLRAVGSGHHAMALRTDGQVVAWGENGFGQCNVPALPVGMTYVDLAAAHAHSVVLRSDGQAFAFGDNTGGMCTIPPLPAGMRYTEVDAGYPFTQLRRSDDTFVWAGSDFYGVALVPPPPTGKHYRKVRSGERQGVGLFTDGTVTFWPTPSPPFIPVPPLPFGVYYVEADAGQGGIGLRRSDGEVVACGVVDSNVELVPPLEPCTSYVQLRVDGIQFTARVGPTSTYVSFGQGCAGSLPASRLVPENTPRIAQVHRVNVFDLPQSVALMMFGWTRMAPTNLASYGMPGCIAQVNPDGVYALVGQNGVASYELGIPNLPSLVGAHFYNQAVVLDPSAGNALGAVVSDAAEGVIGNR
jgi:alpha-tubulin suppressor-like RCC1 family protein